MKIELRKNCKAIVKYNHKNYLQNLTEQQKNTVNLERRFVNLSKKLTAQFRKNKESINSIKGIHTLSRILFGLQEDIKRLKLPNYDFETEKEVINHFITYFLEARRASQYKGECEYYGETLLNLYLDIFITLTCLKTPRKIEHKPGFLINPRTGSTLELDLVLEEFLIAFEFQGESHYREEKEIEKDKLKLTLCATNKVVLIPVNIYQLESRKLSKLILNSIKNCIDESEKGSFSAHKKLIRSYKKACQRMYLSETLFSDSLAWLDYYAKRYRDTQSNRNPVSSSTEAPRLVDGKIDETVGVLYNKISVL